ncbi:MAG: FAD-dependent oxidoreductase, partial [Gammaproteobacteria bacterium]|nr:FAD-dependent oxidoreductase [Gammaproteobacteria bacterium]
MSNQKITIIGSGFAALTAVRQLRKRNTAVEITVISPRAAFLYLPSLIWIPSRIRSPEQLQVPLDNFFRRMHVNFIQAEMTGLKDAGRTVITDQGEVSNDALLIASGGRFIKKLPGIEHVITPCEGIPAAVAIRDRLE